MKKINIYKILVISAIVLLLTSLISPPTFKRGIYKIGTISPGNCDVEAYEVVDSEGKIHVVMFSRFQKITVVCTPNK